MANVTLDLRDAVPLRDVIRLSVEGMAGGLTLVLPQGWAVDTDRLTKGLGSVRNTTDPVPIAGCPVVVITGSMGLGTFVARGERFYERWAERGGRRPAGAHALTGGARMSRPGMSRPAMTRLPVQPREGVPHAHRPLCRR